MRHIIEKPGTVLLFRKENTDGVYRFLETTIKGVLQRKLPPNPLLQRITHLIVTITLDKLSEMFGHNYIHAELVLPKGYMLAAWFNGVVKYAPSDRQILMLRTSTDVFIPKIEIDSARLDEIANKYVGKPYDFTSLILNFITQLRSLNNEYTEEQLEQSLIKYYDNSDKMICSELIARIYEELGYKIERHSEFVTPDDIANSPLFLKV